MSAPAFYSWQGAGGAPLEGQGKTRDLSFLGAFVLSESLPPRGAHLEINVHLPAATETRKSVQLRGEGKVLRVSGKGAAEPGFAAEIVFHIEGLDDAALLDLVQ
jgi:hypothetical protein